MSGVLFTVLAFSGYFIILVFTFRLCVQCVACVVCP